MAKKSELDAVLDSLDEQIAKLQEAKQLLIDTRDSANPIVRRERKTRKAKGLPKRDALAEATGSGI